MTGTAAPYPSSDNFWSGSANTFSSALTPPSRKNDKSQVKDFLSSIDESPDFYDPYSDLNLFLCQKIKQEMQHSNCSKKWSLKVQEELLKKITPDFQKKFPHYRLGVAALKKTWEKIALYLQQLQDKKDALTKEGKLNIDFFIKENLKQYLSLKNQAHLHPCHFAHQLALKMSEYIATIDGVRPKLDHLTKMIWCVQRHLLRDSSPKKHETPYDEYDKIDKLIVKTILEISAKEPQIGSNELEHKVKESLHSLHELPNFSSQDMLTANASALLAEKLYGSSTFHSSFFAEQKTAITRFIQRHSALCKTTIPAPQLTEQVRRIIALYTLASQLPKTVSEQEMREAIGACYPVAKMERPSLPQSLYAFIAAELVLMRNEEYCHSTQYVIDTIWAAYQETTVLPQFQSKESDILEIVIWKLLSETEGLLEKLPYRIGQRIEEEIANILIDNPSRSFSATIQGTVQLFKRTKELILVKKWADIERKIHTWVIQGDMLCRWIRLDNDTPLFKLILSYYAKAQETSIINHTKLVSEISQDYIKQHPELAIYGGGLSSRIWILYKYIWYTCSTQTKASSLDRFLQWHLCHLLNRSSVDCLEKQLCEISNRALPLTPLDPQHLKELISSVVKQATPLSQ